MNALDGPSQARAASRLGTFGLVTLWAVAQAARLVLFALLAVFEPMVRWVLSLSSLVCFMTCAFYALVSPPGLRFPYALGIALGVACAGLLATYELLIRALEP